MIRSRIAWFAVILIPLLSSGCDDGSLKVIQYPSIDSLETSDLYKVLVNNRSVWVEKFRTSMEIGNLATWFTTESYTREQQEVHIANFSCQSQVLVTLRVSEHIKKVNIRPKSRKIKYIIEGDIIRFSLPGPDKLYIEVNELPPLCFFANPPETEVPDPNQGQVRYFGPGIHEPGMMILKDNDIIYIAGGAVTVWRE